MRVALDVSAVPATPAGAGRYVVEIAKRLATADTELELVARTGDEARWREWSPSATVLGLVPAPRPARLLYEATALGRNASVSADLWHGPHYTMPRRRVRPTVVTICDMTFFTNPEWLEKSKVFFFQRAIRYSARHADALISISETTTALVHDLLAPTVPITTIPLGVNLERFGADATNDDARLRAAGLPTDRPYFFFLGTFEPRKGLDLLLDAFGEVAATNSDVELWLGGQSGWGTSGVAATLETHPFKDRIRRLGYVDDSLVPALMRQSQAVCYPSRGEGFGLPVLEALACGAEVLTTAGTVMEEVAGQSARLVPVGDVPALAAGLLQSLELDAAMRADRSRRAQARASTFTWERTAKQHRELYASVLAGR